MLIHEWDRIGWNAITEGEINIRQGEKNAIKQQPQVQTKQGSCSTKNLEVLDILAMSKWC